jgi:hypothetical protein
MSFKACSYPFTMQTILDKTQLLICHGFLFADPKFLAVNNVFARASGVTQ